MSFLEYFIPIWIACASSAYISYYLGYTKGYNDGVEGHKIHQKILRNRRRKKLP